MSSITPEQDRGESAAEGAHHRDEVHRPGPAWRHALLVLGLSTCASAVVSAPAEARQAQQPPLSDVRGDESVRTAIEDLVSRGAPESVRTDAWQRTVQLYEAGAFAPHWVSESGVRPRARAMVAALASAHHHGLRRSDYALQPLTAALESLQSRDRPDAARLATADVLLTGAFAAYAADMLTGRLNPRTLEAAWHIDPSVVDVDSAVRRTLGAERFDEALVRLAPQEDGYTTLMRALATYRTFAEEGGWQPVAAGPTLWPGDSAQTVPALRARLAAEGYLTNGMLSASDHFGADLAAALARFQATHGLEVDSAVGPRTREALNVPAEARVRQIAANLERYRWLTPDLGEQRIIVNIPAFRLDAYDGERNALSMRVVVGRELADRRTPVFSDSMSYVQFGPYWNVPRGIALEEILPEARADRSYLDRNNYEIVRGWGDDAPVVNARSLSYAELTSQRYRVRQRPGPDNALGRVKFMFPNDFAVYLHDTPAQSLFDERHRAYSHGCVRVADPAALAEFVLGRHTDWTSSRIAQTLGAGERVRIDLQKKIPVYLIYLTAFEQDGALAFRDDLYDRDEELRAALGNVLTVGDGDAEANRLQRVVAELAN